MIFQIIRGCYPLFAVIAVGIMIRRIRNRTWRRQDSVVLAAFAGHILLECLQLLAGDGKFDLPRRYLLPVAPLLFVWAAQGVSEIFKAWQTAKVLKYAVAFFAVMFLIYDGMKPSLKHYLPGKKGTEAQICTIAGKWIREDYQGQKQTAAVRHGYMYHSPYLPTVYCRYQNLSYSSGGRVEPSPFCDLPDYWVVAESEMLPADGVVRYEFRAGKEKFLICKRGKK